MNNAKNVLVKLLIEGCNLCPGCHRVGYYGTEKCFVSVGLTEIDPSITFEQIRKGNITPIKLDLL